MLAKLVQGTMPNQTSPKEIKSLALELAQVHLFLDDKIEFRGIYLFEESLVVVFMFCMAFLKLLGNFFDQRVCWSCILVFTSCGFFCNLILRSSERLLPANRV